MDIIHGDELAERYDELIERAANDERIIVSHAGKQVAIVSFDDLTFLEETDRALDRRDVDIVRRRLNDASQVAIPFVPAAISQHSTNK